MAKEHIYTRAKEGYFTHSEGYDTVAVSESISKEYIDKNICPFCFYDKNTDVPAIYYYKYIDNPLNNSKAVIFGRNSYIHSARNYILSNSLIVCDEEELNLLDNNFEQFIEFDSYSEVPKFPKILDDINIKYYFKQYDVCMERELIFNLFPLDELQYKYLLKSILSCVEQKQTLYIKLKCDKIKYSRYAKKLIKILFINIPRSLKRKLSYITYCSETKLKIFFHIVFLDRDASVSSDSLCFDFNNCYKCSTYSAFLDFAWKNILLANKMILNSEIYSHDVNNLLCCKSSTKILEACETKIISSYKNLKLEEYISTVNLFFDLISFKLSQRDTLIKVINYLSNKFKSQLKYNNNSVLLNTMNFLAMKKFKTNTDAFLSIVYNYYNFSFEQNISLIKDSIYSSNNFEDFIIISYFYVNYLNDLLNEKLMKEIYDTVNKKLLCFKEKTDLREENINGLSVYLWTRYRDWI